jgi:aspartate carbamoyltransferase catalytic subunit
MTLTCAKRDILGLKDMDRKDIDAIFHEAYSMRDLLRNRQKSSLLSGTVVVNAFFENSTRTRISFEVAAKKLGADVINFSTIGSSVAKGESFEDTLVNLEALGADAIVIRHTDPNALSTAARILKIPVLNGGAGSEEHPSQALLDIFTLKDRFKNLYGRKIVIVGDIRHSRVAKSNLYGLLKFGAKVVFCGPPDLLSQDYEKLGAEVEYDLTAALENADAVMALRMQFERQEEDYHKKLDYYRANYQINGERLRYAKPDLLVMHPGPINRDIEITSEVADGPQSVILEQVNNGVAIRMSLFKMAMSNFCDQPRHLAAI